MPRPPPLNSNHPSLAGEDILIIPGLPVELSNAVTKEIVQGSLLDHFFFPMPLPDLPSTEDSADTDPPQSTFLSPATACRLYNAYLWDVLMEMCMEELPFYTGTSMYVA